MHKHIIGMLWLTQETVLATAHDVAMNIIERIGFNKSSKKYGYDLYEEEYSAKQYTDFRCSTNLNRFKYCPECGEKIDWKKVMVEIEKELDGSGYAEKS